jgi:hypothetical protein
MRINDILLENKKVTEAPLGMLSKIGHGVKSAFGSGKSSGVLDTGNAANKLKQDYMKMLGSTGQEAEPDNLISFLQKAGYPVDRVKSSFGGAPEPKEPTMDPENPQTAAQEKPAANRPQGGGKVSGQQSQTPGAVAKRNSRRDAKNAAATTGGAGAFNQMGQQLTQPNDAADQATAAVKGTSQTKSKGVQPTNIDQTNANLQTKIAANKAGATQDGEAPAQEPTPTPTSTKSQALGPKGRATLGRLGKQKQDRENPKQGTLDLSSRQRTGASITEALSDKQIDSAFLMAVQDKAKGGGGAAAPAGNAPSGSGSASNAGGGDDSGEFTGWLSSGGSSGSGGISLKGIDVRALKAALTNVVNDRPLDTPSKGEIQKLLKQI